ncbi:hypothetical protein GCM10023219_21640 [Stakelama sediminis]|uniref:DUF2975 domain-containing protein n=1 Tax=Stakelama sediminis TaxID=463200 RepID=A0A840Z038_9SPHN|nr:DUF2975 domain-containing protein [Stakelama sediminis]MBB5719120.1 hypothetical protein [Stakelama sediminis]
MAHPSPLSPGPRLIRDARVLALLAGLCLAVTAAIDLLEIGTMALRSGHAGMSNGGFAFIVDLPWETATRTAEPPFVPIAQFTLWQSLLATILLTLRLLPGLLILWSLMRLFGGYGRGEVFTDRNTRLVRWIAGSLLAYAAVPLLTHAALYWAGMSPVAFRIEIRQLDALAAGLILLAIARVVSFGCAIDEDRRGFV